MERALAVRRGRGGFSLIELIFALSMTTMVLAGVMSVYSSMLRFHLDAGARGEVSSWTVVALDSMNQELENASQLASPVAGTPGNELTFYENYTATGTPWSTSRKYVDVDPIKAYHYCITTVGNKSSLIKYFDDDYTDDPATTPFEPSTCGDAGFSVVARHFYPNPEATAVFTRVPGGVEMHYIVGESTPSTPTAGKVDFRVPIYLKVDTTVRMNKSYNIAFD